MRMQASSPRAWGCFVYDQEADLETPSLPHVRGGVSEAHLIPAAQRESSPRAWGCFQKDFQEDERVVVFPTCVGVFPTASVGGSKPHSLPHVRGGVSLPVVTKLARASSSPRAWGCFRPPRHRGRSAHVFPTCVGVFLTYHDRINSKCGLPHVRGGVSGAMGAGKGDTPSSPRAWGCFQRGGKRKSPPPVFPTCVGVFLLRHQP